MKSLRAAHHFCFRVVLAFVVPLFMASLFAVPVLVAVLMAPPSGLPQALAQSDVTIELPDGPPDPRCKPPSITCPANMTVSTDPGQCSARVSYPKPTVTGTCPGLRSSCSPASGSVFPVGVNTVTCTATDSMGHSATCSFTITVQDREKPVITCPDDIYMCLGDDPAGVQVRPGMATATDNCPNPTITGLRSDNGASTSDPTWNDPYKPGATTITWTATDRAGNSATCQQKITVFGVALEIHKPAVIDPAEPVADRMKGAQTFVNLDNDDRDATFDLNDNDVAGGDNELCRLTLRLNPSTLTGGTAALEVVSGGNSIRLWERNTKGAEFNPATVLNVPADFQVQGNSLVKELWVEGIAPNNEQRQVRFRLSYTFGGVTCSDNVYLTVIGIDSIVWQGQGNSRNNDNNLDADPNFHNPDGSALAPGADRVFPDARTPNFNMIRNRVNARITLSVKPVEPVNIYFRSFDVDDPGADAAPLDNEANADDNRGIVPAQAGQFTGQVGSALTKLFTNQMETIEFQVTMQPGDNFRIVGNGDRGFLVNNLENDDRILDVGASVNARNENKQRIIDRFVNPGGTPDQREILQPAHYASKTLTVWRFLHVEKDSMGPVNDNSVSGYITGFVNPTGSKFCKEITVSNDLRDGSKDLDSAPSRNGRFEKGTLTAAGVSVVGDLDGNGRQRVVKSAGLNITGTPLPFSAIDNDWWGNSTMSGTVTLIFLHNGVWWLKLNVTAHSETPIDWPDFIGGTISIGGGPNMEIVNSGGAISSVAVGRNDLRIPYSMVDDDMAVGTQVPMPDTSKLPEAFTPAYVLPLNDAGASQNNLAFIANMASGSAADVRAGWQFDAVAQEANPNYWTVYLRGAFQHITTSDYDPNSEGATLGIVDDINGQGANIYEEVLRPQEFTTADPAKGKSEAYTVAHEVGHLFGGLHTDGCPAGADSCAAAGLMAQTKLRESPSFNAVTLNKIRSIAHP